MSIFHYYYPMKPKKAFFRRVRLTETVQLSYFRWKEMLDGRNSSQWHKLCGQYGEDLQFGLLRALAIVGTVPDNWDGVFRDLCYGVSPFTDFGRTYFEGRLVSPFDYFVCAIGSNDTRPMHYPPTTPYWLLPYGFSQQQYLEDLNHYWDNVHDEYYTPWEPTCIGQDSPETAQIKRLGAVARTEIDEVARHGNLYLNR